MKILITLPKKTNQFITSIDDVLQGKIGCSGSNGSAIRLAELLFDAGLEVYLSSSSRISSTKIPCILHENVEIEKFDKLIILHTHWDGVKLSFGNEALPKTILWAKNHLTLASAYNFFRGGGIRIVCPSYYHANISRALPQWRSRLAVAYNPYCPIFCPPLSKAVIDSYKLKLLFIGAISKAKGFVELTRIWSYLAKQKANISLVIAGSINIHNTAEKLGPTGVAEEAFDLKYIQPWLKSLPSDYQPEFLGNLSPLQLRDELYKSWAVIVNPGGVPETFCVSAVDAQACNKTVFSVKAGALEETVYQGNFQSLARDNSPEAVGNLILRGLEDINIVEENGKLAGKFVRSKFDSERICENWISLLSEKATKLSVPYFPTNTRDAICDFTRITNTSIFINKFRKPEDRELLKKFTLSIKI